jgi:hypothetical protein
MVVVANRKILAVHWGVVLLAAALSAACASSLGSSDESAAQVDAVLLRYPFEYQVSAFVGVVPQSCFPLGFGNRLCGWTLGPNESGWQPLAATIPTADRINLICKLPVSSKEARKSRSCSVHPRRSDRGSWSTGRGRARNSRRAAKRDDLHARANALLSEAGTLEQLSRLIGAVPDNCDQLGEIQRCQWIATSQTWGHTMLALATGVNTAKKVRFTCMLPANGWPRRPDTCLGVTSDRVIN